MNIFLAYVTPLGRADEERGNTMPTEEEQRAHLRKITEKISADQKEFAADDPTRQGPRDLPYRVGWLQSRTR